MRLPRRCTPRNDKKGVFPAVTGGAGGLYSGFDCHLLLMQEYYNKILNSYGINGRGCKTNMLSTCLSMTEKGIGNS